MIYCARRLGPKLSVIVYFCGHFAVCKGDSIFSSVVFRAEIPKFDGIIPAEFRVFFLPPKFYGIGIIPSKLKIPGPKKYLSYRAKWLIFPLL